MILARDMVGVFFDEGVRYTIAGWADPPSPEGGRRLDRHEARWALERLLGRGRRADIVAVYDAFLRGPLRVTDEADVRRMLDALVAAADRGHLRIYEVKLVGSSTRREVDEDDEAAGPARAPREEKTWIEIVLTDDDDPPRPVAFARYRIELPDGSTREGILDDHGKARLVDIDPGTCQVSFPSFDGRDWS